MTLTEVMTQLEAWGTEQNRKVYAKHGAKGPMFGVSFANFGALQKKLKTDHALALQLWETGNYDARMLATLLADPQALTGEQAEAWAKNLDCYPLVDAVGKLVARSPLAQTKIEQWHKAPDEWLASAGWNALANLSMTDQSLPEDFFVPYLALIESGIHQQANRVRHEMNGTLIAIGVRNEKLEKRALAIAATIGKVEVDHGETSCKTPDVAAYIKKVNERRQKQNKAARKQ